MVNGQMTVLGSRVGGDDYRYQMDVTSEGAIPISGIININNIAGSIVIGSVSANVDSIYVTSGTMSVDNLYTGSNVYQGTSPWIINGSVNINQTVPTDSSKNNPKWSFDYDANGNVGSVYQMIGTGSYVNTLTWIGFSGTLSGIGSRVTNVSSWSVI